MKTSMTIFKILRELLMQIRRIGMPAKYPDGMPLLRSKLISSDHLEQHGRHLARSHKLTSKHHREQLLARLKLNENLLIDVYNQLTAAVAANHRITPASEWLLDNFYLIEEQIRTAKSHLPKHYSRELPLLLKSSSAGLPRVYDIALEGILYGDGWVDPERLSLFVTAYQSVTALKLGELWAIPIMMRLALIENIRHIAVRIAAGRSDRDLALSWAGEITETAENNPKNLILVIADMARSNPPMTEAFVSEFMRQLQGRSPALALPLNWIEQQLAESGLTIEQLVESGNRQQASCQVSISNSIRSLRFLGIMDWSGFVEEMSVVEQTLLADPNGIYGKMDFASRDNYRHIIEKIAKQSPLSEGEVAKRVIELAKDGATRQGADDLTAHVGFYLIDKGLPQLEQRAEASLSIFETLKRTLSRSPLLLYLGSITLITLLLTGSLLGKGSASGVNDWALILIAILLLLASSKLAVALVNALSTLLVSPKRLPRMDFSKGIPPESRTLVVVPTMLTSVENVEDLVKALEVRMLSNWDENLHFSLLTDFRDADKETLPEDALLLRLAHKKIDELNEKYSGENSGKFFLFHRPRRWNPMEEIWMGYERKRGKLNDLNSFLLGGPSDCFSLIVGATARLSKVKYVITLDTDTQLPRDSAWQLIGTMVHTLNRPRYDQSGQRVCAGYGILQPRVSPSLPGTNRSRYARLYGGTPGIDPYTRTVSDIYQDLFGEGSFIGKGIYDIDAVVRSFNGSFPENQILSHDLIEGCYARSGLLSDVELYEEYPSRYSADVSCRHRWIRGDWQLAGWLLPRVSGSGQGRKKNPLSGLSLWKIFDNLRRSLVPAALTVLLLSGWTLLPWVWFWTLLVIVIIIAPHLLVSFMEIFRKPDDLMPAQHLAFVVDSTNKRFAQAAFELAALPYEAYFSLDAIVRAAWRMLVTHKRLLEWDPSCHSEKKGRTDLIGSFRLMWAAPAIASAAAIVLLLSNPVMLLVAGPILFLWLLFPYIAWRISRPLIRRKARLSTEQTFFLRKLSRKTWAFFETFVGPQDHWLPPDNYQEYRVAAVAHRTSPTNMGLSLLANLSAFDFGYIPAGSLIERTTNALNTMAIMERYQGHFFNWYDTQSLQPLKPHYISSVDSGNLAAHLLTLRQGLLALPDGKILEMRWFDGLTDTLMILIDAIEGAAPAALIQLQVNLQSARPATLQEARLRLELLATSAQEFADSLDALSKKQTPTERSHTEEIYVYTETQEISEHHPAKDHASTVISETGSEADASWWAWALVWECRAALNELTVLAPWLWLPAAPDGLSDFPGISEIPTLRKLARDDNALLPAIEQRLDSATPEEYKWLDALRQSITEAVHRASVRIAAVESLAQQSNELAQMDYHFLYDKSRRLLAIGYNVEDLRRDSSYYDLLASEARLCNFVAIAQGQLPQESWFALGRLLTSAGGEQALMSWGGSMFEYLMPLLVMPTYENTLLDQTYKAAVERQIDYGKQCSLPWGMSESGYNTVDVHFNYQYRSFGVPGLGLKRGLTEDLVIAPYASALALMVAPEAACQNLQRLAAEGFEGKFGLFEAIDYTPSRQRRDETRVAIRSHMAHHQGMSLLSLAYLLLDRPMQKRFKSSPPLQATLPLLQERIPKTATFYAHIPEFSDTQPTSGAADGPVRVFDSPDTPIPGVHLLSNGSYTVMITNAGGGYSRWKDLALTRWREDSTCDGWGTFGYIRDVASGEFWSTTHQPTLKQAKHYEVIFSEGRAEFRRSDNDFDTYTEIVVSPEDDIELRRIRITNHAATRRTIDVTSYAEVVLASSAADAMHPAFSNLFVQTEIIDQRKAILCTRRPRSPDEQPPCIFHLMTAHGADIEKVSYETDRMQFIGRGNTLTDPQALTGGSATLSGSEGSVLDPIVSIRYRINIEPGKTAVIDMVAGIGETRAAALKLVEKYHDKRLSDRVFDLAWTHSQIMLGQLDASESDAQLYAQLASSIIYGNAFLRAESSVLIKNRRGQSGLWGYAISGDLPIVLLQIGDLAHIDLVRKIIQAHAYWHIKGLAVDLVIWNEDRAGYRQLLQEQIIGLVTAGIEAHVMDQPGGIFVRTAQQISNEDRTLFQSVARAIITDRRGTLAEQIKGSTPWQVRVPSFQPTRSHRAEPPAAVPDRDLILFNGIGGFTPDGREYIITTEPGKVTPAPWVNVLANAHFGSVISENGSAYTWSENAHEFRLTPWNNDPVSDAGGEVFYLRDEESGHFWSPTPLPSRGAGTYISRHGFGYSIFEHTEDGIHSELCVYVALDAAVKFSTIKVRNESGRSRQLSATGYAEWVLGDLRAKSAMHVISEIDSKSGALFARNAYSTEFSDRVAFFDVDDARRTLSGDRTEFIGRNGTLKSPAAMTRSRLSGNVGAALDPCAAIQVPFELAAGEEREIRFTLGAGRNTDDARNLVDRFRGAATAYSALEEVWQYWQHTLSAVQVETPDPSLNVLANGWLLYQTIVCRLWARSGYYQSGGAFGFRDQLQDVMALVHTQPQLVREQLLLCASRQFIEGDVQHWWHPPSGQGVRTHCSDDYLWLPLATCRYVLSSGDIGILDESAHFLEGSPVNPEDDSYYNLPDRSSETVSLYQHCVRAILHGLNFGEHGLPLIGSGDWNDGMNLVGMQGKGESVWLGFFLCEVLNKFTVLARLHGDFPFAKRCKAEAAQLRDRIEQHGWDGKWYRRAYFDDGTPLGSASNSECQIDSISQSWSVLSGTGDTERSRMAMDAVYERLVRSDHALIQLLDPPFDKSPLNPGYIKGYAPGIRENGGQYTHAAVWAAMAFAELGDSQRAWELLAMINPVNHGRSADEIKTYKVEPYVLAGDVYAVPPHTGRGGWSWYTGSAGWMYRLIIESLLGLRLEADKLHFAPCFNADWPEFKIHYRYRETLYHITVTQTDGETNVTVDGIEQHDSTEQHNRTMPLIDDRQEHIVEVRVHADAVLRRDKS
jgi:cyclic beta-1,2-glucan synthetase